MKRLFDFSLSLIGLLALSPILFGFIFIVWLQDLKSPFYVAPRVGKNMRIFRMVKLRSMVVNADQNGVDSKSSNDMRITTVGRIIRKCKLDELTQLWNILIGDMSFVGPRPNVEREVALYTAEEQRLLCVRPGITDFSSIVFSDEGDILKGAKDPDLLYNQLIRPWKSRLGLFCIEKSSFLCDLKVILLTVVAIFSRHKALKGTHKLLKSLGADRQLLSVSLRNSVLLPHPPPGADLVVKSRSLDTI